MLLTKQNQENSFQSSIISDKQEQIEKLESGEHQKNNFWTTEIENNLENAPNLRFRLDKDYIDFRKIDKYSKKQISMETENAAKLNAYDQKIKEDQILFDDSDNEDQKSGMENGRQTRFYFDRLQTLEYASIIFASINILLGTLYYEQDIKSEDHTAFVNSCLSIMLLNTFVEIFIIISRYKAQLDLEKKQLVVSYRSTLYSSDKTWSLLIEIFIILLQPYSFLNNIKFQTYNFLNEIWFDFKLNWTLTILSYLRGFIICRYLLKESYFMSPRASRLCRLYGCESTYQYAIKCMFEDYPISLIFFAFTSSLLILASMMKMCESPVYNIMQAESDAMVSMNFPSFFNCCWCILITMTTVGYGDYYPRTLFGRWIAIISSIWGTFIMSMLVLVLQSTVKLNSAEIKSLTVLNRLDTRKVLREKAAFLLTCIAKHNHVIEKRRKQAGIELDQNYLSEKLILIKKYTDEFKVVNRKMKGMYDKDNVFEEMGRQFDFIQNDIGFLKKNQERICKYFEDCYKKKSGTQQNTKKYQEQNQKSYVEENEITLEMQKRFQKYNCLHTISDLDEDDFDDDEKLEDDNFDIMQSMAQIRKSVQQEQFLNQNKQNL